MAISRELKINITGKTAKFDKEVFLYQGDKNIDLNIEIIDSEYKYDRLTKGNILRLLEGELSADIKIVKPDKSKLTVNNVSIVSGKLVFRVTSDLIDELKEIGVHYLQIFIHADEASKHIPKVEFEVVEPLFMDESTSFFEDAKAGEDKTNECVVAKDSVRYALRANGDYVATNWQTGDLITAAKLNKIEAKVKELDTSIVNKAPTNHTHSNYANSNHAHNEYASKSALDEHISNHPSGGGGSTTVVDNLTSTSTTSALSANQGKVLDNKITVLSVKLDNHLANHPSGEGGSFEIITPNGTSIKVKAMNDGTLETELPVIPTSELPSDFPKFTVKGESKYEGNFFITPHDNNYNFGYFIIINPKGEVLYYKKTSKGLIYAPKKYTNSKGQNRYTYIEVISRLEPTIGNVQSYENGELVVLNENFDEIDRVRHRGYGNITENFPCENHDYVYIDDNHYILQSYFKINGSNLFENSIQELRNRKVVFHFETNENPTLKELSHTTPTGDYAHINSTVIDYDDNLLVSFRNIGIVKINRKTKEIMWVIGRNRCDFEGITPSQIPFQQHDIQLVADGSFTVFDNAGHGTKSRVCRFNLDEENKTCIEYKEYISTRNVSGYMGSATIVDDENEILDIAYGAGWTDISFEEYDFKNNKQLMLLKFNDGSDMYRVFRDLEFKNTSIKEYVPTPVESVTVSPLELNLVVGRTSKVSHTILPSNAYNKNVTFDSSDESVATVDNNGIVLGVNKGSCVITVTTEDGNKKASCSVSVVQGDESQQGLIYQLEETFEGDGTSKYVDTNIKLFDTDKDWTLFIKHNNYITKGQSNMIASCWNESVPYRGLLHNLIGAWDYDSKAKVCVANEKWNTSMDLKHGEYGIMGIRKEGTSYKWYTNKANGVFSGTTAIEPINATLLLGCSHNASGEPYRFSDIVIYKCEVYDSALDESFISTRLSGL